MTDYKIPRLVDYEPYKAGAASLEKMRTRQAELFRRIPSMRIAAPRRANTWQSKVVGAETLPAEPPSKYVDCGVTLERVTREEYEGYCAEQNQIWEAMPEQERVLRLLQVSFSLQTRPAFVAPYRKIVLRNLKMLKNLEGAVTAEFAFAAEVEAAGLKWIEPLSRFTLNAGVLGEDGDIVDLEHVLQEAGRYGYKITPQRKGIFAKQQKPFKMPSLMDDDLYARAVENLKALKKKSAALYDLIPMLRNTHNASLLAEHGLQYNPETEWASNGTALMEKEMAAAVAVEGAVLMTTPERYNEVNAELSDVNKAIALQREVVERRQTVVGVELAKEIFPHYASAIVQPILVALTELAAAAREEWEFADQMFQSDVIFSGVLTRVKIDRRFIDGYSGEITAEHLERFAAEAGYTNSGA
jgi:hypothetical protein